MLRSLKGQGNPGQAQGGGRDNLGTGLSGSKAAAIPSKSLGWKDGVSGEKLQGTAPSQGLGSQIGADPSDPAVPNDGEKESVLGDRDSSLARFRLALRAIYDLCPDSVPSTSSGAPKLCDFEGMFAQSLRPSKEDIAPTAFHRNFGDC